VHIGRKIYGAADYQEPLRKSALPAHYALIRSSLWLRQDCVPLSFSNNWPFSNNRETQGLAKLVRDGYRLNYMVQYTASNLDLSFAALADATRRGIIEHLGQSEASITTLATKFKMTLTGMKKHVQVLERAGLVMTRKVGRVRTCMLGKRGLEAEAEWIEDHRKFFEARFSALDKIIDEMEREKSDESAN
jgi:DNA-binding transcriptional ArsR family regulator